MLRRITYCGCTALAFAVVSHGLTLAADTTNGAAPRGELMESDATRDVVALVRKAAELVRTEGEAAFDEFRVPGSVWNRGESYVFVNDTTGTIVVDPNRPELEGTNQIDLEDQEGRAIIQTMIAEVSHADKQGWVHYLWPKFALSEPYWKSSFVVAAVAPSGKQYVVGSGIYDAGPQGVFVIDTVNDAAALIESQGRDAFDTLREPNGPFRYHNTYVFVFDERGLELVNGAFPGYEEQNLLEFRDAEGNYPVREMIDGLKSATSGWFDYSFLAPDSAQTLPKSAFVRKLTLDGETLYVGSGLYIQ